MSTEISELDNLDWNTGSEFPAQEDLSSPEYPQMDETAGDSGETPECLIADYRFIRLLGEGTSGKTYLAERRADKKKVAVKELKVSSTYKSTELFERESAALSHIDVPGVPKYYGYVKSPDAFGAAYLIQEYVPYPSLQKYLDDGKVFEEDVVLYIMQEMAKILEHLETDYSPAIIHRDIKPSNIMYDEETGDVSLIDFGAVANPQKKTMGSTVAGTMGFMAPEQLMGDCSIQSDYYALGATALYLLTGVSPANMKHAEDDPFKLEFNSYLKRNVSKKMKGLLTSLLAVKSSDRPKNISVFKESLSAVKFKDSLPAEKSDALPSTSSSLWNSIKKTADFIFSFIIPGLPLLNSIIIALSQVYDLSSLSFYDKMYAIGFGDPDKEILVSLTFVLFYLVCLAIPLPVRIKSKIAVIFFSLFVICMMQFILISIFQKTAQVIISMTAVYIIYIFVLKIMSRAVDNPNYNFKDLKSDFIENISKLFGKSGSKDKNGSSLKRDYFDLYIEKLSGSHDDNDYYECSYKNRRGQYSLKLVNRSNMCEEDGGLWFKDNGIKYKVIDEYNLL